MFFRFGGVRGYHPRSIPTMKSIPAINSMPTMIVTVGAEKDVTSSHRVNFGACSAGCRWGRFAVVACNTNSISLPVLGLRGGISVSVLLLLVKSLLSVWTLVDVMAVVAEAVLAGEAGPSIPPHMPETGWHGKRWARCTSTESVALWGGCASFCVAVPVDDIAAR